MAFCRVAAGLLSKAFVELPVEALHEARCSCNGLATTFAARFAAELLRLRGVRILRLI